MTSLSDLIYGLSQDQCEDLMIDLNLQTNDLIRIKSNDDLYFHVKENNLTEQAIFHLT